MALWTMTPDGERVLVVPAHRAYAASMPEDDLLTTEESARLKVALREKDRNIGCPVHYGPGKDPLCGEEPVGTYWSDEPESVVGCDGCLELVAEDLADNNDYQGRCLHCREPIAAKGGAGRSGVRAHIVGSRAGDALVCPAPAE